jgi:DNA-binding beta-propeller fold protein YncE
MKSYCRFFIACAAALLLPVSLGAQQKHALVIGNGAYTTIPKLNNPVNDAADMKAVLEDLGFQVDLLTNVGRVLMEEAVERFKSRLASSKNAYGFLFYAGHGVQSGGENYLIPIDADIRSEAYLRDRAVSVQAVLDELNSAGNALNIVALDACRDNPFGWSRSGTRGLQVVSNQPADSIIIYATSEGKTAADGEGRNSPFTSHFLKNLKTPGLEINEVFRLTGRDVARASGGTQIPAIYSKFFETAYLGARPAPPPQLAPVQPAPAPQPAPVRPTPAPQPAPQPTRPAAQTQRPAPLARMEHSLQVYSAAYSPDGKCIVSVSNDNTVKVWDTATGNLIQTFLENNEVNSAVYSPDGRRIVFPRGSSIQVWDATVGRQIYNTISEHSEVVRSVAYSPDGSRIVSASRDKKIKIWDAATGQLVRTLSGHSDYVTSAAYSPDGSRIVSASNDKKIKIWNASNGRLIRTLTGHSSFVFSAAYSPDGSRIVSASWDDTIKVWDAESGRLIHTLSGHSSRVISAAYSPDGRRIVSASSDKTVKVWDAATGNLICTISGHSGPVNSAAYSPDGTRIVSASDDKTVRVWDAATGEQL